MICDLSMKIIKKFYTIIHTDMKFVKVRGNKGKGAGQAKKGGARLSIAGYMDHIRLSALLFADLAGILSTEFSHVFFRNEGKRHLLKDIGKRRWLRDREKAGVPL